MHSLQCVIASQFLLTQKPVCNLIVVTIPFCKFVWYIFYMNIVSNVIIALALSPCNKLFYKQSLKFIWITTIYALHILVKSLFTAPVCFATTSYNKEKDKENHGDFEYNR